ncbi:MAG: hypothetical protein ACOCZE_02000 [Planctomycetota bacterium]
MTCRTEPTKMPLRLAVTGHRDIDPGSQAIQAAVCRELDRLVRENPDRSFAIASALAEGADRMVAELAMQRLSASLTAVLPMPADQYEQDFAAAGSVGHFRKLLAGAGRVVELPVLGDRLDRSRQYALAGAWLVGHCDVLLALWDGRPPAGHGGTAEVVQWMVQGAAPPQLRLSEAGTDEDLSPDRLLIHIHPGTGEVIRRTCRER